MPPENASPSALTAAAISAVKAAAWRALFLRDDQLLDPVQKSADKNDWFTQADGQSQDLLCERLPTTMPDGKPIAFEGEEKKGRKLRPALSHFSYRWIVDPVDGTKPFKEGGHEWAVSAALQRRRTKSESILFGDKWETVIGVLYCSAPGDNADRMTGTIYWAEKEKRGAHVIDLATRETRILSEPLKLGTTVECNIAAQPSMPNPQPDNPVSESFTAMLRNAFRYHQLSPSYARSIAHTAMQAVTGRKYATLFEVAARDWDIAALKLIAEKSGVYSHIEPVGQGLYSTRVSWDKDLLESANRAAAQTVCAPPGQRL
jgi:fructose-1,6-bisphosphatase/inositol monophosphatase family enzyme